MGPPAEEAAKPSRNGKQSVRLEKAPKYFAESPIAMTPGSKMAKDPKCPSTVSSYVGGFLQNTKNDSAKILKDQIKQNIKEMNDNLKDLPQEQV
jgi:hypothetical protein